ncbi:MAG TPA: Calx-beta domain-containing protein [Acidimicrobiia bacterium]|nr:Calx-beta domain-containing protein [Acidimicrobiia bacterium]
MRRTRRAVVASVAGIAGVACLGGVIASGSSTVGSAANALTFTTTTAPTTTTTGPVIPDETELVLSDAQVLEGDTNNPMMRFSVRLPLQAHRTVLFHAAVDAGGSAQSDVDYVNPPYQAYTIPVGQSETFINVPIISDTIDEPNETFIVVLGGTIENATVLRGRATGTIIDDDPPRQPAKTIAIDSVSVAEGRSATLTVSLSEPAKERTVVRYRTVDGTAVKKHDYADTGEQFSVELFRPTAGWTAYGPGVVTLT